jgi:hypothetical protein
MNAARRRFDMRLFYLVIGSALGVAVGVGTILGDPPPAKLEAGPRTEMKIIEEITSATDLSLDYLARKQITRGAETGSWSAPQATPAVTALSILAFLSSGHIPARGKYGDVIEEGVVKPGVLTRAKRYMLSRAASTGYISSNSMYEHGLATLALAEMYGIDPDQELEEKLRKAVDLIVRTQSPLGGWRYQPQPGDQDMSVTVMQIVALRAANNAEIPVPETVFQKAVKYVQSCAAPGGGFGYSGPGQGVPTSAAGTLSLQLLGKPDDANIRPTLAYLAAAAAPNWGPFADGGHQYFYYAHYYAIQAHYHAGGKEWNEWHPKIRDLLLRHQNKNPKNDDYGSWDVPPGTTEGNLITPEAKIYSTALATLILNIYKHILPAYQR